MHIMHADGDRLGDTVFSSMVIDEKREHAVTRAVPFSPVTTGEKLGDLRSPGHRAHLWAAAGR